MRLRIVLPSWLPIALAYGLLAVLFTWPLALRLGSAFPSADPWFGGDPHVFIWYVDWLAKALTGATAVDPSTMVYWPQGIDPMAGYDGLLFTLAGLPVALMTGDPVLAYDVALLLAFVTAALAGYVLFKHLGLSKTVAVIGGAAWGFSPYMLVRGTLHANLVVLAPLPLLALALIRFVRRPTGRNALWLGGAVLLNGLSSSYYHVGGLLLVALAFVMFWHALRAAPRAAAAACGLVLAAAILPVAPMLLSDARGGQARPDSFVAARGARPMNFVLPHPFTNVFGGATKEAIAADIARTPDGPTMIEYTSYLGLPLLVGLIAFLRGRSADKKEKRFWLVAAGAFVVLSLGTTLFIGGRSLPLPFAALRDVFPFSLVRVPNRFFPIGLLAATVAAAYALDAGLRSLSRPYARRAALAVLGAVLISERLIFPYPLYVPTTPRFYEELAREPGAFAIVDLPITNPGPSQYNFFQTVHGKPIVEGEFFHPALSPAVFAFIKNDPLLSAAVCAREPQPPSPAPRANVLAGLAAADIRYVVVHNLLLRNEPLCAGALTAIRSFFAGMDHVYADGEITVYATSSGTPARVAP